jgi:hypothetical protein
MPILEANSAAHERVWQAKVEVKEKKNIWLLLRNRNKSTRQLIVL